MLDEKAIAGLLAEHRWYSSPYHWTGCVCDRLWWKGYESAGGTEEMYFAHVASVIAAHMAAPDELTALVKAWDEGYAEGVIGAKIGFEASRENPYRAALGDS